MISEHLAMLERQIEEQPPRRRHRLVEAAFQSAAKGGDWGLRVAGPRAGVERKMLRGTWSSSMTRASAESGVSSHAASSPATASS